MAIDLERFIDLRPFLFHLTAHANLAGIRSSGVLESTNTLFERAGMTNYSTERRVRHLSVGTGVDAVLVRDQKPLHSSSIEFDLGWSLRRFISHVNDHVFFWPGSVTGVVGAGRNHYGRYGSEDVAVLRIPTASLRSLLAEARFSRFNSGAPRVVSRRRSPRGAATYADAGRFEATVKKVVEVVFRDRLQLPRDTTWARSYRGPWQLLFEATA